MRPGCKIGVLFHEYALARIAIHSTEIKEGGHIVPLVGVTEADAMNRGLQPSYISTRLA